MADGPRISGRDIGRRIVAGLRAYVSRISATIEQRIGAMQQQIEQRMDHMQAAINNTPTMEMMRGEIDAAVSRVNEPVSVDALLPLVQSEQAKWALDFERRAQAVLERAIDRMPKPQEGPPGPQGEPGEDGAQGVPGPQGERGNDGGSIEDFDIGIEGRMLTVAMKIGERVVQRTVRLDIPQESGIYQSGKTYQKSDMVTYAGSVFIATRDTTDKEKPEASTAWRLMVKRGKDGKDGDS